MSDLITPPKRDAKGCPLGWATFFFQAGRVANADGSAQIGAVPQMPPCIEKACMFWRSIAETIVPDPEGPMLEEVFDCALAGALSAAARTIPRMTGE